MNRTVARFVAYSLRHNSSYRLGYKRGRDYLFYVTRIEEAVSSVFELGWVEYPYF